MTERDGYDITMEGKLELIATAEAAVAVNYTRNYLDPTAKVFPGHSSDRDGESP